MKKLYADNASSSFPKAPGVGDAVKDYLDNAGYNVNRGGYGASYDLAIEVLNVRKQLCGLFNSNEPKNTIFTPGITYSLNIILQGFLKDGDHIVTTSMEHNAVMRPLHALTPSGITYSVAKCRLDGSLDVAEILKHITNQTKAVAMTHASNVCGTVLPIYDVADICKKRGIKLIVDAAQTAGVLDIDMSGIDALAFTSHKGLLALPGLGGFLIKSDFAEQIKPVITGGTGSFTHQLTQPTVMPDKFEAGTLNIPAILGLKKSLEYIEATGVEAIYEKEMRLAGTFIEAMQRFSGVRIVGKNDLDGRLAVVSLDFIGKDNSEVSAALDSEYGIMTRCGLHCSPLAHKTLQTYPGGTVRFSFGHFNTIEDVKYVISALNEICT
ncbi:MAG: aminotransferase class V-fold PLP-dependent enzyme [Defluviitaleaceae bacterium]|nr:aminotransferase class V-fold PLP-dependent enzyme [Defluviitaleaceae bacterium]